MRTVIAGGTVVSARDSFLGDVLIEGEKIISIGHELSGDTTIDAAGKYVIPGGIRVRTHLDMPFGGTVASDDFFTGHRAAAFGGTTTHVDFAIQPKGASLRETLDQWHAKANGKAAIDYGFHLAITDLPDAVMQEIASVPGWGVTSLKLFMAYKGALMVDDATLFRAMEQAAQHGLLIMVHAENGDAIDILVRQALEAGHTEPKYHALTRPPELEAEATNRAIRLADFSKIPNGCPGIEDRMMVLYTQSVRAGRFSLNRWVELCCTNPAKLFGMYPQKGVLAPGSDADIVVWDPAAAHTISAKTQHQRTDYNLYEGMQATGMPAVVLSRGRVLVQGGQRQGRDAAGPLIPRQRRGAAER